MGNIFNKNPEKKAKNKKDTLKKDQQEKQRQKVSNEEIYKRIVQNINILKSYDADDTTQYETRETRELLLGIDDAFFSHRKLHENLCDLLLKHKYLEIVYPLLYYYAEQGFVGRKEIYLSTANILNTIWNCVSENHPFRKRIAELGYVKLLLYSLSNTEFVQLMDINEKVKFIVQSSLAIFHSVSRSAELKDSFKEIKALTVINKLTDANHPEIKSLAYMFLANVATNEDDVSLIDKSQTIPFLVAMLSDAMRQSDRAYIGENAKFPAHVIIESLNKLSVEDANRLSIHDNNGVQLLLYILTSLNVMRKEQQVAANAVWMLSYNDTIKAFIKSQTEQYELIHKLAESSVNDEIRVSCKGILMVLNDDIKKKAENYKIKHNSSDLKTVTVRPQLNRQIATEVVEQTSGHIMISYNKFSRDVCLKIKQGLDQHFETWMDVTCIYGDALDSMADAVERASVVLICMTENYKESANCAIEAKYTLALNKPYVPLKLQSKYRPRGWLGMLLNYKIYIDFADKPFEDSFNLLLKEINQIINPKKSLTSNQSKSTNLSTEQSTVDQTSSFDKNNNENTNNHNHNSNLRVNQLHSTTSSASSTTSAAVQCAAYRYSNKDLLDWLHKIGLESYKDKLKDYDGKRLYRLFNWKQKESHLYYNFVSETFETNQLCKTTDIIIFEEELEKLFS